MSEVYAPPVQRLITELGKLPGIGNRTAQRLAFHILRASDVDAGALAEGLGIRTGVDLDKVMSASRFLARALGRELPSKVLQAGGRLQPRGGGPPKP